MGRALAKPINSATRRWVSRSGRKADPIALPILPIANQAHFEAASLFLALRAPKGRAAVLDEALDDAVAAFAAARLAFSVIDLKRMLEIAEFAGRLAMIAQR